MHSLIHSFIYLFVHSFIHSFNHSFSNSATRMLAWKKISAEILMVRLLPGVTQQTVKLDGSFVAYPTAQVRFMPDVTQHEQTVNMIGVLRYFRLPR